jgi:sulfite reductase beta subunit-like hemoprotein
VPRGALDIYCFYAKYAKIKACCGRSLFHFTKGGGVQCRSIAFVRCVYVKPAFLAPRFSVEVRNVERQNVEIQIVDIKMKTLLF